MTDNTIVNRIIDILGAVSSRYEFDNKHPEAAGVAADVIGIVLEYTQSIMYNVRLHGYKKVLKMGAIQIPPDPIVYKRDGRQKCLFAKIIPIDEQYVPLESPMNVDRTEEFYLDKPSFGRLAVKGRDTQLTYYDASTQRFHDLMFIDERFDTCLTTWNDAIVLARGDHNVLEFAHVDIGTETVRRTVIMIPQLAIPQNDRSMFHIQIADSADSSPTYAICGHAHDFAFVAQVNDDLTELLKIWVISPDKIKEKMETTKFTANFETNEAAWMTRDLNIHFVSLNENMWHVSRGEEMFDWLESFGMHKGIREEISGMIGNDFCFFSDVLEYGMELEKARVCLAKWEVVAKARKEPKTKRFKWRNYDFSLGDVWDYRHLKAWDEEEQ